MKILYLSCHSILEYDEISLFHELGHKVFSPGAYLEPNNPGHDSLRPNIPSLIYSSDILEQFHGLAAQHPGEDAKNYLTKEFVDNFDCIIVMHLPQWISNNWEQMKHKRVIWRTIGQSVAPTERQLKRYRDQGMEIVRYSPKEHTIPGFIGEDALIRFYKNPDDYGSWNGNTKRVISFAQHMQRRDRACNYRAFEQITRPFPRHLFGPGNEGQDWTSGKIPFEQLQLEMQNNRVYFYTGTHPASYTLNFIEAWMTGIPIVALGPRFGNASYFPGYDLYEISDLIENGANGFISDHPEELQQYIAILLENDTLAQTIGQSGRKSAIELFGKNNIAKKWRDHLNNVKLTTSIKTNRTYHTCKK